MKFNLDGEYFEWLCNLVAPPQDIRKEYKELLFKLQKTPFEYSIGKDSNREAEGIELRYRFGSERNIAESAIACLLDVVPCSVLEMMVALSLRIEDIMLDEFSGYGAGRWFWNMIKSLDLLAYYDGNYDEDSVQFVLYIFMQRRYHPNGAGGLFTLKNPPRRMTDVEIWLQAMWWLDEQIARKV